MLSDISPIAALRRSPLVVAPLVALLALAPATGAATRHVAPGGADTGNCLGSPCVSLGYAYGQSAGGDLVRVEAGTYGPQVLPAGTAAVRFLGASGTKLRELDNYASNVTFQAIDVDANFANTTGFENHDGANVVFRDARIGNVTDEKGALISGTNFTFDNVVLHDVRVTDELVHNECVYAIVVPGMTVRNSSFYNCATMDLFFTYGDWWTPMPPAYGNVTLENNVFGHTYKDDGTWHYYSLAVGHTGPESQGWGTIASWVVRNNTFELPAAIGDKTASGSSRWVGNLGDWDCISGMTFRHNVGLKCHSTDKQVSPAASSSSLIAPLGWISPATENFRLKAGSPAINAADPNDHPATDRDGFVRGDRPDAGAHEFGAGPPTGGGGGPGEPVRPGAPKAKRLRIRSARLKPHVICVRPRHSCPAVAKLRLAVSARSRVSIRVERLRHGHKPRRVRSLGVHVHKSRFVRLRARGLRPGRYRVVIVARSPARGKSAAKVLLLRVRRGH